MDVMIASMLSEWWQLILICLACGAGYFIPMSVLQWMEDNISPYELADKYIRGIIQTVVFIFFFLIIMSGFEAIFGDHIFDIRGTEYAH